MRNQTNRMFAAIVVLSLSSPGTPIAASCDAILRYGIVDELVVMDERSQYELVKNAQCSTTSRQSAGGLDLETDDFTLGVESDSQIWSQFCSSDYREFEQNSRHREMVRSANPAIANAWSQCVSRMLGTHHVVKPTADPAIFSYEVQFIPMDGSRDQVTVIKNWDMSNTKECHTELKEGQEIGGKEVLSCTKDDPSEPVVITMNTTVGNRYMGTISLKPVRPAIPPPPTLGEADFERRPGSLAEATSSCAPDGGPRPVEVPISYPNGKWNLSLLKTTTAQTSSTLPGFPTRHTTAGTIDGWYNNCRSWIPATQAGGTVSLNFGKRVKMHAIKIGSEHQAHFRDRRITAFVVKVDGAEIFRRSGQRISGTTQFDFPTPVTGSTLSLEISGPHPRLDELEVLGTLP